MKVGRKSFCCWVNVLKIVVKFIGYENLMICKVTDKREAPSGGRQPSTAAATATRKNCCELVGKV